MSKPRGKKPAWQKAIARKRNKRLFELAEEEFGKKNENTKRYIQLARKIAMRYNVRIPKDLKKKFYLERKI